MISKGDFAYALNCAVPGPTKLDPTLVDHMVDELLAMCVIKKNSDHFIWAPEDPEPPIGVETPTGTPPRPEN